MHPTTFNTEFSDLNSLSKSELSLAKKSLRQTIRATRKQLSLFQQLTAANKLLTQLRRHYWFNHSNNVALYLANDGELSCQFIIQHLLRSGKTVALPVLHPINRRQLFFLRYDQHTPMRFNRFGIKEPLLKRSRMITPESLDLILMPLVGFDLKGNRLGMGGGFYDTTMSKIVSQGWRKSPRRVGLAHTCQQVAELPQEPWDIPLNAVVTPKFSLSIRDY